MKNLILFINFFYRKVGYYDPKLSTLRIMVPRLEFIGFIEFIELIEFNIEFNNELNLLCCVKNIYNEHCKNNKAIFCPNSTVKHEQ